MQVSFCFDILDMDFVAQCHVTITHPSVAPNVSGPPEFCDPGEVCEWELEDLTLYEDVGEPLRGAPLQCPEWLLDAISESSAFNEAVCAAEQDEVEEGPDPDADWDRDRGSGA
jgi:hypothetical protein